MSKKTVEFEGHRIVKKPSEVEFTTNSGKQVDFIAQKPVTERVRVKFKADVGNKK